jgi:uncharacterized membrane protein
MSSRHPDLDAVRSTVNQLVSRARDPHDTGFVSCRYKQDLLELKWYIEDALDRCPSFGAVEDEWQKQRTLQLLKK